MSAGKEMLAVIMIQLLFYTVSGFNIGSVLVKMQQERKATSPKPFGRVRQLVFD